MPSHVVEGSHSVAGSGALAGEQIYADSAPATDLIAVDMNAVWHGLRTLIRQEQVSGDLTAGSGATDLSEGFIRLTKAIRRAAARRLANNIIDISSSTGIASPFAFNPNLDESAFTISGDNGDAVVLDGDPKHDCRLITLTNKSSSSSFYVMYGSGNILSMVLPPSASICMYRAPGSPSSIWMPVGGDQSGSFDIEVRSASTGVLATGKCKWKVQSGFAHLTFYSPTNSFLYDNAALAGSHTITITASSNTDFPASLSQTSEGFGVRFPVYTVNNNVIQPTIWATILSGGTKIDFFNAAIVTGWTGHVTIAGFSISYPVLKW